MSRLIPTVSIAVVVTLAAVSLRAQDANAGKEIYLAACAKCHGDNGVPRRIAKKAPNFADQQWAPPPAQVEQSIRDGKGSDMKPFKAKLKLDEIKNVAAFVLTLKSQECIGPCGQSKARP